MQANETPFASTYWHKELQKKEVQEEILQGTYEIPAELPLEAKEILYEMRQPEDVILEEIPDATLTDFRDYVKKSKNRDRPHHRDDIMGITRFFYRTMRNTYMSYMEYCT